MQTDTIKETSDTITASAPVGNGGLRKDVRIDIFLYKTLYKRRKYYILPFVITVILTAVYVYSLPRYYNATVKLAPEASAGGGSAGGLTDLASMAGVNLGNGASEDAIVPVSYPDLIESTDFIVPLLSAKVRTAKGDFSGSYGDYLMKKQRAPWWQKVMGMIKSLFPSEKGPAVNVAAINPFWMNKRQNALVKGAGGDIKCDYDNKTGVITITTTSQDALIAALMADTVSAKIQQFIIAYRTKKAKNDLAHYQKLLNKAAKDYETAQHVYSAYADANQDVVLATYRVKEEKLENDLQLAFNTYSKLKAQVQLAEAKVTERTPVFTVLQNATVPIKPAGPKRMFTIIAMLIVCFIATSFYFIVKDAVSDLRREV